MPARKKRNILFVAPNPVNRPPVRLDEEQREVEEALRLADQNQNYQLVPVLAARVKDLRRAIQLRKPAIVHVAGHGENDGIYLEDADRTAKLVTAEALRDFLAEFRSIECVILNACYTETQAGIIAEKVEYVIGMRAQVGSSASIGFAVAFYDMLGSGEPYERAFAVAKASLGMDGLLDGATPIFKLRPAGPVRPGGPGTTAPPPDRALRDVEWVSIPAQDSFVMGSDPGRDGRSLAEEMPAHPVDLPAFSIAKYPVTNSQYARFVMATGHRPPTHFQNGRVPPGKENHPVTNVSWLDAIAYCKWLSRITNQKARLPSEAQWEKAARGGDGRIWPWGDDPPSNDRCNYDYQVGETTPVDRYPLGASAYGIMDMAGNVWEWTSTKWGQEAEQPQYSYPYHADDGRESGDQLSSERRVFRGGTYGGADLDIRCAFRASATPDYSADYTGFRVVVNRE